MKKIREKLVDKRLVHKNKEENVLIYNIRRALPVKIEEDIFNNIIIPVLTDEEKCMILDYYILHRSEVEEDLKYYVMYDIPHVIEIDYVRDVINHEILSREDLKTLLSFYHRDEKKKNYILKKNLTEIDEMQILNIMEKKDLQLLDYDNKEKISKIFEGIKEFKKDDIFFANLFVNKDHPFFFEHSLDHVPAMMLLEAGRQFLIALCHLYGNIVVDDTSFIISKMSVEFIDYLELNYPVKIIANVKDVKKKKDGSWRNRINITIFFYQNNIKASKANFIGRIANKEGFIELRRTKLKYREPHRFIPVGEGNDSILLKDCNNKNYNGRLKEISESGFQVQFVEQVNTSVTKKFDFVIFFQDVGFIHGKCELKWFEQTNNFLYKGGFKITDIKEEELLILKEGIKKICFIKSDREYL